MRKKINFLTEFRPNEYIEVLLTIAKELYDPRTILVTFFIVRVGVETVPVVPSPHCPF